MIPNNKYTLQRERKYLQVLNNNLDPSRQTLYKTKLKVPLKRDDKHEETLLVFDFCATQKQPKVEMSII